jgi:tripartite-type tricarboxylate transporter receptor subunit TctC
VRNLLGAIAIAAAIAGLSHATAQTYPSRPVTMVVPFAPGGPTDTIARIMAEQMRGSLGQPVIIENVSGAGGSIGVGRVARAAPDGYTLSVGNLSSHVMNGAVYSLSYDVVGDFSPIALLSFQPFLIVARKTLPANNLSEFLAWLKTNSGKATMGIQGVGTAGHVFAVFFRSRSLRLWRWCRIAAPVRRCKISSLDRSIA